MRLSLLLVGTSGARAVGGILAGWAVGARGSGVSVLSSWASLSRWAGGSCASLLSILRLWAGLAVVSLGSGWAGWASGSRFALAAFAAVLAGWASGAGGAFASGFASIASWAGLSRWAVLAVVAGWSRSSVLSCGSLLSAWAGWAGWSMWAITAFAVVVHVDGGHVAGQTFSSDWASSARGAISTRLAGGSGWARWASSVAVAVALTTASLTDMTRQHARSGNALAAVLSIDAVLERLELVHVLVELVADVADHEGQLGDRHHADEHGDDAEADGRVRRKMCRHVVVDVVN